MEWRGRENETPGVSWAAWITTLWLVVVVDVLQGAGHDRHDGVVVGAGGMVVAVLPVHVIS